MLKINADLRLKICKHILVCQMKIVKGKVEVVSR